MSWCVLSFRRPRWAARHVVGRSVPCIESPTASSTASAPRLSVGTLARAYRCLALLLPTPFAAGCQPGISCAAGRFAGAQRLHCGGGLGPRRSGRPVCTHREERPEAAQAVRLQLRGGSMPRGHHRPQLCVGRRGQVRCREGPCPHPTRPLRLALCPSWPVCIAAPLSRCVALLLP